jgi:hypothetical protein
MPFFNQFEPYLALSKPANILECRGAISPN